MNKTALMGSAFAVWSFMGAVSLATAQAADNDQTTATQQGGIAEIVVTAEKRETTLQRTPAAVTAVTSAELVTRGIASLSDTQMLVPAARIQREGNNTQIFVRGIGQNLDFPNIDAVVAFNFNGVYMPREATSAAFFDLAGMEVLPGPQGTLYGRGAMGGTVNVQFKRPGFDNEGDAVFEAGNYGLLHASGGQDLRLSDDFAARIAIDYLNRDGYYQSGADSSDSLVGRLSFVYNPTDTFSAYVWAFGGENNGSPGNLVNRSFLGNDFLTSDPWDDVTANQITKTIMGGNFLTAPGVPPNAITFGTPRAEEMNYKVFSVGGQFDWDIGGLTLTYIPGYSSFESDPYNWFGPFRFHNFSEAETSSHELRFSGTTASIDWLAGVFYYNQDYTGGFINTYGDVEVPSILGSQYAVDVRKNILEGKGIFGQGIWNATESLRFTLGGRYAEDSRDAAGFDPRYTNLTPVPTPWSFKRDYSHFDWKVGLEYDLAPSVLGYVTVQTGSAPGTYNFISATGLASADPLTGIPNDGSLEIEQAELLAYTAGIKSRLFDNTLQLNLEGFRYTYKDIVEQQFNANLLYNPVFNAEEMIVYGVQADLAWQPTAVDDFSLNVAYTHARNEKFITPNGSDYGGLQPPYSPDWTILGSYTRTFMLQHGSLDANVSGRYESSWWASLPHAPGTRQGPSAKLDASLTYDSGENWTFGLWGKNLSNEAVLSATAAGGIPGPGSGYLEAPRTYGVRLTIQH